jgi:DNA-binding beta-propeller fold protein YncE
MMAAAVLASIPTVAHSVEASLILEKTFALPGVEGRFDHAAADSLTHRVFFAALGNNSLEVLDVKAGKRLHTIADLKKPTGVAFLPGLNLLVVANGDDGTCRFFDGTSYAETGRISGLDDADNVRFDAMAERLYVGFGDGALAVIDPAAIKLVARIDLPKHPESFQLEENGPRIFVNVPEAQQIAVVDRIKGKIVATWPLKENGANFPMALNEKDHRLFVGCRQPSRLLVFNTETGDLVAEASLAGDADDIFYEPTTGRLAASCGEGILDQFTFTAPDKLAHLSALPTAPGARTCYWNAQLGMLALAVPHRGTQEAEIRLFRWTSEAR